MVERRLPLVSSADLQRADEAVRRLRHQHADELDDALARRLLWHACLRAAAIGGVTGAAGLLPIPKLAESALGLFGQAAVTAEVQRDLVLRLYALHAVPFEPDDDAWLASQLGQSLGGAEVAEQLGRTILSHLIERYARRLLARGLPAAQIVLSGAVPVGTTWLLAKRTLRRLAARKPDADIVTVEAVEICDEPLALPAPARSFSQNRTDTDRERR
jgi:hypothetical protein